MMVKRKQVEQMYLTRGWQKRRHQYSQNDEGRHTRLTSRSHDIGEQGCWVVLGKREPEESKLLGQ